MVKETTKLFPCTGGNCTFKIGVVGNNKTGQWEPNTNVVYVPGHNQNEMATLPCDIRGPYNVSKDGIGSKAKHAQAHAVAA